MKAVAVLSSLAILLLLSVGTAMATPSKIIWIPSTDVQPFMVGHLDLDSYIRAATNSAGDRDPNLFDVGFTLGILPFEKVQIEVGFDFLTTARNPNDQHPWSGNIKLATPENSMFNFSPAIAVGVYNGRPQKDVEVKDAPYVYSGQNIVYGLVGKTIPAFGSLPSLGRFAIGYYRGSNRALRDNKVRLLSHPAKAGLLVSWDRKMTEISDKLWVGIDYQGGNNIDTSWNAGFAWRFNKNVSLTIGYDSYNRASLSGENTFTTQVDLDFP
jgi:hypothetical protein